MKAQRGSVTYLRSPRQEAVEPGLGLRPTASKPTPQGTEPHYLCNCYLPVNFILHLEMQDLNLQGYLRKWIFIDWGVFSFRTATHSNSFLPPPSLQIRKE